MDFTDYDIKPKGMVNYLRYYGAHFNKNLLEFAVSHMKSEDDSRITVPERNELDVALKQAGVTLKNDVLQDALYVMAMGKADFLGRSIPDNKHLAMYVKDYLDDPDGYEGIAFNRWYADMSHKGIPIDWEDMI